MFTACSPSRRTSPVRLRGLVCVAALLEIVLTGGAPAASPQISPASPAMSSPVQEAGALGIGPAGPRVRGLYLDATPTPSVNVALPGKPFRLRADVIPKSGVHIYAPGNANYTPVALTIDPQPGLVSGASHHPKAVELFFAPLKERVRVFSSAFRLEREMTITPAATALVPAANQTITIKGALVYQACDDKVCYLPQTLPLTWTVGVTR